MFRYFDKTKKLNLLKDSTKKALRRVFGLDVKLARSRKFDLSPYEQNLKQATRFLHFQDALGKVTDVDGHIVECGVGPGRSLFEFAVISNALGIERHIFGFDTFEGLPNPSMLDGDWNSRVGGFWNYSREHVRDQLLLAGLDEEFISTNITLVPGEFSETLPNYDTGPIAFLHIDVDIYESYKVVLECLYDQVVPGGIIAFDEYAQEKWPGATMAIDEFFAGRPETIVCSRFADRFYTTKSM